MCVCVCSLSVHQCFIRMEIYSTIALGFVSFLSKERIRFSIHNSAFTFTSVSSVRVYSWRGSLCVHAMLCPLFGLHRRAKHGFSLSQDLLLFFLLLGAQKGRSIFALFRFVCFLRSSVCVWVPLATHDEMKFNLNGTGCSILQQIKSCVFINFHQRLAQSAPIPQQRREIAIARTLLRPFSRICCFV